MADCWVRAPERKLTASDADEILRFHRSERHLHWAIAIPFMVCYVTAAILVLVYNANPAWPLRAVFSWIHRISGGCLIVLPPLAVVRHWRDFRVHLHNVRWGWKWTLDDVKWLLLMGPATFCSRIALPHQGKFNAGEKINFVVIMCTYPVYVATGLTIWFAGVPFISWLVHVFIAVFVATPLMLGHIFMALVNPDTRVGLSGMLSGFVDRHWARHHYRHWYDQTFGESADTDELVVDAEAPALGVAALEDESSPAVAGAKSPLPAPWPRLPGQVLGIE
jgi:formate dehydrogenase subunit gamma